MPPDTMPAGDKNFFSDLTITQKGLVLVLLPLLFVAGSCVYLEKKVEDGERQITAFQTAKITLLELNKFETRLAQTILRLSNPAKQDHDTVMTEIAAARAFLKTGTNWKNLGKIDPDVVEVLEESELTRSGMLDFIDEVDKVVNNPEITVRKRAKKLSATSIASLVMGSQELAQKVTQAQKKIQSLETEEIARLRAETLSSVTISILIGAISALVLGLFIVHDLLRRLRKVADTALLVSGNKPLPSPERGRDEIARLNQVVYDTGILVRQTRQKELAVLNNAADLILSLDENFKIVGCNEIVSKMWFYSSDELLGRSLFSLLVADTTETTRAKLQQIQSGSEGGEFDNIVRCKNGMRRTFAWNVRYQSEERKFFCVVHDVTKPRAVSKMKQQFVAIVSHDLRAPLAALQAGTQLVIEGKLGNVSTNTEKVFRENQRDIEGLVGLANNLLELDKLESGKKNFKSDLVSILDVCSEAKERIAEVARQKNVIIDGPIGDAVVTGDDQKLIQVMTNLLSNALSVSASGMAIKISLQRQLHWIEVRVADNGPQIPSDEINFVFEKFRRSRSSSDSDVASGLGLAIVKAIVHAHNGEVGVESSVDSGNCFWLRLLEDREDEQL